ncbi:MAG: ABC transporter substrate-binding protein, partial [Oscillospiraceae bacterium]|nr:ABC transporter substrate-binding protein [Oscillospiraceae bacterium]
MLPFFVALCLAVGLLSGCGGTPANQPDSSDNPGGTPNDTPAAQKTMVIGDTTFNSENWEETVDPHRTYNGWACIRYGVGETLVHYTDTMELEPWLAKSWENDGNLTWTVTLQDNVTFSSGRKMDGEAVKQCLDHLLEVHD